MKEYSKEYRRIHYVKKLRRYSEEGKLKLSIARKDKRLGSDNPNWRGGLPNCIECGRQLSVRKSKTRRSCFCSSCYCKKLIGRIPPNWKGGYSNTKEGRTMYSLLRRERTRGVEGSHTLVQWMKLKERCGYFCLRCKKKEPEIVLTRDHIVPITKGGTNYISNIQPLCRSCNSIKNTKIENYLITLY